MKKYNRLLLVVVLVYLFLALGTACFIQESETEKQREYNVEIHRISESLSLDQDLKNFNFSQYTYVKGITFLPAGDLRAKEQIAQFYQQSTGYELTIRPRFDGTQLVGYLRFDYERPETNTKEIMIIAQGALLIMMALLLGILLYFKIKLIGPFHKMSEMPLELAKGHLKGEVKETKSRYFGRFLWGISQLKDTLEVSKMRELELEKEKKQMLLALSHDIKTPLNTIKLYGKALEEDIYDGEEQKKHAAHQIGEKTVEIEKYVEEIIKASREDILNIQVKDDEFYLNDLVQRVLNTYEETCQNRKVQLRVGPFVSCLIRGDLDRVQEVFENLLENALKYGDGEEIEVSFYEEDYCQLVRIYNTGNPVSDNEFNHIFESFFRGSNSASKPGNGLGLYICKQIMGKMNGEIFAERQENGMAFTIVFS